MKTQIGSQNVALPPSAYKRPNSLCMKLLCRKLLSNDMLCQVSVQRK